MRRASSGLAIACVVAMAAAAFGQFGTVDDVPTWRFTNAATGDTWQFTRRILINAGLTVNVGGPIATATIPLNLNDVYTKRLHAIAAVNPGAAGFAATRAYERIRTTGLLTLTGSAILDGVPLSTIWAAYHTFANENSRDGLSGTGYDWVGVGDLAQIRDSFGVVNAAGFLQLNCAGGFINTCGIACPALTPLGCNNNPVTMRLDLALDHGPTGPNPTRISAPFIDSSTNGRQLGNGSANATSAVTAREQNWTLLCLTDPAAGGADSTWSVSGSVSGASGTLTAGTPFTVANEITVTVTDGALAWDPAAAPQDRIRFSATRDSFTPWDFNGGGLELADFPTVANTENHVQGAARHWIGWILLDAPGTAFDINQTLDLDMVAKYNITLASGAGATAATNRVLNGSVAGFTDAINYLPSRLEFSAWSLGAVTLSSSFERTLSLATFTTTNTVFTPDAGATTIGTTAFAISPATIRPGQTFTVSGSATAGTTITGTVLLPGGGGSSAGAAISGGNWSFSLVAP